MSKHLRAAALAVAGLLALGMLPAEAQQGKMKATGVPVPPPAVVPPPPSPPPVPPTVTQPVVVESLFDGPYVGLVAGRSASTLQLPGSSGLPDLTDEGLFGGIYGGFGVVVDRVYWGLEGDAMWRDLRSAISDGSTTVSMSNRWLSSIRARAGLPIGSAMPYLTGGVAVQESVLKLDDPALVAKDSAWVLGLVAGGGIEAQITRTVHVRVEGLHYMWKDEKFSIAGDEAKLGQSETVVRVGVGFKLN